MRYAMRGSGVLAAAVVMLATASPARAADSETGWLPFLGCWQPAETIANPAAPLVCFVATSDAATVEVITLENGAIASRERMTVDGARHELAEGGCTGWESASWSADGRRVYTESELSCEGLPRRGTGMIAMASATEWLDIQVVSSGEEAERGVRVIRYRAASAEPLAALGVTALPDERALITQTARQAAAATVTFDAVHDAVARLDSEAVEAWLIEREARFALNAQRLIELDDAGVPEGVIDLMVALSNPRVFAIDHAARSGEVRPQERTTLSPEEERRRAELARYGRYRPGSWYGFDPYMRYGSWGYDPFMMRYGGFGGGLGWGSYYGSYRPIIVVVEGRGEPAAPPGRAVRGRGYTAPGGGTTDRPVSPASTSSGTSTTSSSGSTGATTQPAQGTSSGRTAQPRRGGGGGSDPDPLD